MDIIKTIKIPEALRDKLIELSHDEDMKNSEMMEAMLKVKHHFDRMRHAHNIMWKMLGEIIKSEEMDINDTWRFHVRWGRAGLEACEIQLIREDKKPDGAADPTPDNADEWMKHFKKNVGLGDDDSPPIMGGFFGGGGGGNGGKGG